MVHRQVRLDAEEAALPPAGEAGSRIALRYFALAHRRPLHVGFHQRRIEPGLDDQATLLELRIQRLLSARPASARSIRKRESVVASGTASFRPSPQKC
jgi:hypothetical protein